MFLVLNIEIPANTGARLVLPTENIERIYIVNENVRFVQNHLFEQSKNSTTLKLDSGEYSIMIKN